MTSVAPTLAGRLEVVHERIARACQRSGRQPGTVTLIAVSKTWPVSAIINAWNAGIADFGENRVQEALEKIPAVRAVAGTRCRFHLVGHLQANKAAAAGRLFDVVHSLDSERVVRRLAAAAAGPSPLPVLLEVNVAGEESKFGIPPDAVPVLAEEASRLKGIVLKGLMTVAPQTTDAEQVRPVFDSLRRLAERHALPWLSMGMSDDFEVAIEEGATHIRIGRAIFGERTTT